MLAYRHAFHAGNHADVLKHLVLVAVLRYLNLKEKGWRFVDTHAGAGSYALTGRQARQGREFAGGIGRLWERMDAPPPVRDYVELVRTFNGGNALARYPGSPTLARMLQRPQDQLRLFELHPTDHRLLAAALRGGSGIEVRCADGYGSLRAMLPPPTRRGVVLLDPPYEIKTDYSRVLGALREALERFAEGTVLVWAPQLQLLEAARLPQRLKATAQAAAPKGWLHARLTVDRADERGFGMLGSSVFVVNPPHTLAAILRGCLPWLAEALARPDVPAQWSCETGP